jgi:putative membrane protein
MNDNKFKQLHWQEQGKDPDYRFSLANERTFLAWMRTALALLATGVVFYSLALHKNSNIIWLGIGLAVGAAVVAPTAYLRWKGNEIAMRHARPLPRSRSIYIVAVAMIMLPMSAIILLFTFP